MVFTKIYLGCPSPSRRNRSNPPGDISIFEQAEMASLWRFISLYEFFIP
jgi:hypothetical protein